MKEVNPIVLYETKEIYLDSHSKFLHDDHFTKYEWSQ